MICFLPRRAASWVMEQKTEMSESSMSLSTPGAFVLTPLMFGHKVELRKAPAGTLARRA